MKIKDVRPESFTKQIRCDRCGHLSEFGDEEFHETSSIELKAGYGSIFGDGNDVQIDLCQYCLKLTLGRWLRIVGPGQHASAGDRARPFDFDRHGGEFPPTAGKSFSTIEDMPVQELQSVDAELPTAKRQVEILAEKLKVPDDSDAYLPPQIIHAFEQMRIDAQAVLAAIEARNNHGICTVEDRAEHSVIKNLCRSIKDRLDAAAGLNAVLTRRLIRVKERLAVLSMSVTIEQLAKEVFESEGEAEIWLRRPHPLLDDRAPRQAAKTAGGAERVKEILVSIKHGGAV